MKRFFKCIKFFGILLLLTALAACHGGAPAASSSSAGPGGSTDLSTLDQSSTSLPADQSSTPLPADQSSTPLPADQSSTQAQQPGTNSADPPAASSGTSSTAKDPAPVLPPEPQPEPKPAPEPEPQPADPKPEASKNQTLYILMYHMLIPDGQPGNDWILTKDLFQQDLQWLSDHGYTTVLPSELARGVPLPKRAVMITFDDGYSSCYDIAFPLLQEYQAKAVINLITGHIANGNLDFLTWEQCTELNQSGLVEFGSHTHTLHSSEYGGLSRAPDETQEEYEARVFPDLQTSVDLIEDNVGTEVRLFAYPLGKLDPWAKDYLQEHFELTVTSVVGKNNISKGLYDLNRYNVSTHSPLTKYLPG